MMREVLSPHTDERSRFEVLVIGLEWVANREKTRWFLVMKLEKAPQNGLNRLLHLSNKVVKDVGQPVLYADPQASSFAGPPRKRMQGRERGPREAREGISLGPSDDAVTSDDVDLSSSFHVSIGWILGSPWQDLLGNLNDHGRGLEGIKINVNTVKVKVGNSITAIPLESKIETANRIIDR